MDFIKLWWKRLPVAVRKPLILIIGTVIVIGGIILLPLPGPGWVIIFFGFAILATEFAFAEKLRDYMVRIFKIGLESLKTWWHKFRKTR